MERISHICLDCNVEPACEIFEEGYYRQDAFCSKCKKKNQEFIDAAEKTNYYIDNRISN